MKPEEQFVIPYAYVDKSGEQRRYVSPRRAVVGLDYRCPECQERIVLRRAVVDENGETLRRTCFAHIGDTSTACRGGTGESEQHMTAKYLVAQVVRDFIAGGVRPEFVRVCSGCRTQTTVAMPNVKIAQVEGRVGELVADVLLVNGSGGKPAVCEIVHTHQMGPGKIARYGDMLAWWVEISASSVLEGGHRWHVRRSSWTACSVCEARKGRTATTEAEQTELQKIRSWMGSRPHTADCRCKQCWTDSDADSGISRSAPGGMIEAARAARGE